MDLMKVFDQTVRDLKREVNTRVLKVPEIEQKVLDATSNEPWGPHGTVLQEIAQATKNFTECQMIMNVLWTRLADTGRNWRHVYKALSVIEYLVANGAERVVDDIIEHTYQISSISEFEYVEPNGKDVGINVRKKVETILALLNNKDKIQEVRQKAAANRDKYFGLSSTGITFKSSSASYGGSGGFGSNDRFGSQSGGREEDTFKDSYKDRDTYGEDSDWKHGKGDDHDKGDHDKSRSGITNENEGSGSKKEATSYGRDQDAKARLSPESSYADRDGGPAPSSQSLRSPPKNVEDDFDDFDPRGTSKDEWWRNFGIYDLELQTLAIRILSQTCSSSGCERNWSVFERIHTKRRNRLEHKRLNDLVYTHYNLRLKERQASRKSLTDPISVENIDLTDDWVVEAEDDDAPLLDVDEIDDWMDVADAILDEGEGGAAAGATTVSFNQVDLLDQDLFDAPTIIPATTAKTDGNIMTEVDLFADADFVSAVPHAEGGAGSHAQPKVDLFAQQPAFAAAFPSTVDFFAASGPSLPTGSGKEPKSEPINSTAIDPFATVPLNNFDGSELFGDFTSHTDSLSTEPTQGSASEVLKKPNQNIATESKPPPKKDNFQIKSGIWADSLSRGLIDLNISAPKKVDLADLGIVGGLSDGSEEKAKAPTWTASYMGRAMGSGSGLGRSGFTSTAMGEGSYSSQNLQHHGGFK